MNALSIRLLSLALFAALCATATYWAITLSAQQAPLPAAAARALLRTEDAAVLFGGQLTHNAVEDIHLFGILALRQGAAAIIGVGGNPTRTIAIGDAISPDTKLAEVRARSIVIDRDGAHTEIFLPANTPGPAIYVR